MEKVFISYASAEINEARNICSLIEQKNIKCFIAERDIRPGREYAGEIIEGLKEASTMVVLMSKASNASPHVLREVEYAVSHHRRVIVYQLEEVELSESMQYFLMACQWIVLGTEQKKVLLNAIYDEESETKEPVYVDTESRKLKGMLWLSIAIILVLTALIVRMSVAQRKNSIKQENSPSLIETIENEPVQYAVGDTISFGSFNDEAIEWRLIKMNDDGTAVLIAKNILTVRAFDCAEGGEYNEYDGVDYWSYENHIVTDDNLNVLIRGNNEWRLSNIRTWLNSDKEMVNYEDQAPTRSAACLHQNFYSETPGFLYSFTAKEKEALILTKNLTAPNRLSENLNPDGMIESEDYVYLLSTAEIDWIKEAGISIYAMATDAAREKDETHNVDDYQDKYQSFWYWTRDPAPDTVERGILVKIMSDDEIFETSTVGVGCYGIRPAITVNLSSEALIKQQ